MPVALPDRLLGAADDTASADDATPGVDPARILVVGDPETVDRSGLALMEPKLLSLVGGPAWRVDWLEIGESGAGHLQPGFTSFASLLDSTAGRKEQFFPQTEKRFNTLMQSIETALLESDTTYDLVIWIVAGATLPNTAPARFEDMISRVSREGHITRRGDGGVRAWLQVVSAEFNTPFAEFYLDGPLKTTRLGKLSTETRDGGERRGYLLTNPENVITAIKGVVDRKNRGIGEISPASVSDERTETYFDAPEVLYDIGVLVRRDKFERLIASIKQTSRAMLQNRNGRPYETVPEVDDILHLVFPKSNRSGDLVVRQLDAAELSSRLRYLSLKLEVPQETIAERAEILTGAFLDVENLAAADSGCSYILLPVETYSSE
ncbi:MAG TPA: hypothetical protein ENK83_05450 [Aliiroseovarius sp.]|nr:hypothetical protein [Aliiroseovarius sp.]